ncbi:MAG: PIG-L family deacetylase [Proteobacteria bacterium]|nr:PIG-L family deacetylase [Pseudomonadota bacterium]
MAKKLLIVGAHPDDAEFHAGALMCRAADSGWEVQILCLTDGSAGHHEMDRDALRARRAVEARTAAQQIGAGVHIWDVEDGMLVASLVNRLRLITDIRRFQPDVLVTHRPWDYHPDHRACGTLVQDACYMISVPAICADTPVPANEPIVLLMGDHFQRPAPCRPDLVLSVTPYLDRVTAMLNAHESQVYEWLPHVMKREVGADRPVWLGRFYSQRGRMMANLIASNLELAEILELSEYGRQIAPASLPALFESSSITS